MQRSTTGSSAELPDPYYAVIALGLIETERDIVLMTLRGSSTS
jgi:hypothetical protein